jgi:uncharacterized protein (TIGR02996 family)
MATLAAVAGRVTVAHLNDNSLTDAGLAALADGKLFRKVESLSLRKNQLNTAAALPSLASLKMVDLTNNPLVAAGRQTADALRVSGVEVQTPPQKQSKAAPAASVAFRRPPEQQALLEDIGRHADDVSLRRMYADWLDDHGQAEQAEFVRSQAGRAEGFALYELPPREADLLDEHGRQWAEPLYQLGLRDRYWYLSSAEYRRGLVEKIDILDPALFLKHGGELLQGMPTVQEAEFREKVPIAKLAACPHLGRLRGLTLPQELSGAEVRALLDSPHLGELRAFGLRTTAEGVGVLAKSAKLAALRSLELQIDQGRAVAALGASKHIRLKRLVLNDPVDRAGARALARSAVFAGLRELELSSAEMAVAEVRELAATTGLGGLRRLVLNHNPINDEGLNLLGRCRPLTRLERLDLMGCWLTDTAGLRPLTALTRLDLSRNPVADRLDAVRTLRGLRWLSLGTMGVTPDGLRPLFESDPFAHLVDLHVDGNPIGDAGAAALAEALPPTVETLALDECELTAAGVAHLAQSPRLASVRDLVLNDCPIGTEGARALARSPHLRLRRLSLKDCEVGDSGVEALLRSPVCAGLVRLNLWGNGLTDRAARLIAESAALARVKDLCLYQNRIGDAGAAALAASPHLGRVDELWLQHNRIGDAGFRALAASTTLVHLFELELDNNVNSAAGIRALVESRLPRLARVRVSYETALNAVYEQLNKRYPW